MSRDGCVYRRRRAKYDPVPPKESASPPDGAPVQLNSFVKGDDWRQNKILKLLLYLLTYLGAKIVDSSLFLKLL